MGKNSFSLNDKVVYPGHGVARINRIIEKEIGGIKTQFFELKFLNKDMTILVPTTNLELVGVRRLSSAEHIDTIFQFLAQRTSITPLVEACATNWNRKSKKYKQKIESGDLREISTIYKDLQLIADQKDLSFGEKNLLEQIEMLIAQEISLVKDMDEQQAREALRAVFNKSGRSSSLHRSSV